MITRLWMNEGDGAMRLVVELDDGDRGLVEVDLSTDPATTCDLDEFDPEQDEMQGWVELVPRP